MHGPILSPELGSKWTFRGRFVGLPKAGGLVRRSRRKQSSQILQACEERYQCVALFDINLAGDHIGTERFCRVLKSLGRASTDQYTVASVRQLLGKSKSHAGAAANNCVSSMFFHDGRYNADFTLITATRFLDIREENSPISGMPGIERTSPIRIFLATCRTGSFAATALELHLSSSAVAKAIARLEARLAIRLFERTTRSLTKTQEAVRYRSACQRLLDDLDATEAELAAANTTPSGLLRVTLPPVLGTEVIAPALFALVDRFPLLSVDIDLGIETVDLVASPFELAVRVGQLPDTNGLTIRSLGIQRVVLCASADYLDQHGVPHTADDLRHHSLIATSHHGRTIPWLLGQTFGDSRRWAPPARLHLDGSVLTLQAIRSGRGIGCVPEWMAASDLVSGRLRTVLGEVVDEQLPIHAVWPSSPVMMPRLRVAIDAIVGAVRDAGLPLR